MSDVKDVQKGGREVEVLAWVDNEHRVDYYNKVVDNLAVGTELVNRAHVLRLQGEVERLKDLLAAAELVRDRHGAARAKLSDQVAALRSETDLLWNAQSELTKTKDDLTKARALISETISGASRWQLDRNLHERLRVYITKQSDPVDDVRAVGDAPFGYWCSPHGMPLHGLFNKTIEPATEEYCKVTPLYRRPQRQVVLPERMSGVDAYRSGWNACLDEIERLNK